MDLATSPMVVKGSNIYIYIYICVYIYTYIYIYIYIYIFMYISSGPKKATQKERAPFLGGPTLSVGPMETSGMGTPATHAFGSGPRSDEGNGSPRHQRRLPQVVAIAAAAPGDPSTGPHSTGSHWAPIGGGQNQLGVPPDLRASNKLLPGFFFGSRF